MSRGPVTHGHTIGRRTSPTYRTWIAMMQRCLYPRHVKYPMYGARGVTVCERWRTFANFLADMGERPPGTTIDRFPDGGGNYEPGNCRWATPKQQTANRTLSDTRRTHCPAGHPYTGENVRQTASGRKCRTCERERAQRKRDEAGLNAITHASSGFRGVRAYRHRWQAHITDAGRVLSLGMYETAEEAAAAYDDAARRLHGAAARTNFPEPRPFRRVGRDPGASGLIGVQKDRGRWKAFVGDDYLGSFATLAEAARVRDNAARERYGDKARLNFPEEEGRS